MALEGGEQTDSNVLLAKRQAVFKGDKAIISQAELTLAAV